MPDISELNGTAIANVAEFDALTVTEAPAFTGLLDTTYGSGAAAAYSTRRLASATTVLMRVRRDTGTGGSEDDDEADVAYDSNNILSLDSAISNASAGVTATTLGQFINVGEVNSIVYSNPDSLAGTASCYVDTWYDQAGSNDAEQTAQGSQPQIHDGSSNTDLILENGKPAVDFMSGNTSLINASLKLNPVPLTMFFVAKFPTKGDFQHLIDQSQGSTAGFLFTRQATPSAFQIYYFPDLTAVNLKTSPPTTQALHALMIKNGEQAYNLNGTTEHSGTASVTNNPVPTNNFVIGTDPDNTGREFIGTAQEFIFYKSDETDNYSSIETDVMTHFSIT